MTSRIEKTLLEIKLTDETEDDITKTWNCDSGIETFVVLNAIANDIAEDFEMTIMFKEVLEKLRESLVKSTEYN